MSGAVTRFKANSCDTSSRLLSKARPLGLRPLRLGPLLLWQKYKAFCSAKNGPRLSVFLTWQRGRPNQERMQPHQKGGVQHRAEDHGDDIVPCRPCRGNRDEPRRLAPLERDAVEDGIGEERAKQDDGGKVAIGYEMGERPGLDGDEEGMLELRLDPPR